MPIFIPIFLQLFWPYDLDFPVQFWFKMYFSIIKSWTPESSWWVWSLHLWDFNRNSWSILTLFLAFDGLSNVPLDSKEHAEFSQGRGCREVEDGCGVGLMGWWGNWDRMKRSSHSSLIYLIKNRDRFSCVMSMPLLGSYFKYEPVHSVPEEPPRTPEEKVQIKGNAIMLATWQPQAPRKAPGPCGCFINII